MYIDICDNLRYFCLLMKQLYGVNVKKNNKLKKLILVIKYKIYTKFNIIKVMKYDNNKLCVIYSKKDYEKDKLEKEIEYFLEKINNKRGKIYFSKCLMDKLNKSKEFNIQKIIQDNKNDKTIFRLKIIDVLSYILKIKQEKMHENNIYILSKNVNANWQEIFLKLAEKFKSLNIVTYNIKDFKILENAVYEKVGAYITVSNNKRKGLAKAKYIINLDYCEKEINEYNLNRSAIIINISDKKINNLRGFCGIIINNIIVNHGNNKKDFDIKTRFNIYDIYQVEVAKIVALIGNNSYILEQELQQNTY